METEASPALETLYQMSLKRRSGPNVTLHCYHQNIINLFTAAYLLYVPPGLTFANSTFCPHSVCVLFMDLRTNREYFPVLH